MQAHGLEGMRKIELMHASKANDAANEDIRRGVRKESSTTATQESILSINEQTRKRCHDYIPWIMTNPSHPSRA